MTMGEEVELPSRYEIRPLELKHVEWAKAIFAHSFVFSPTSIWRSLYPSGQTARFYGLYQASDYLIRHQVASGLSLGLFDSEYVFQQPNSAATGGALYFDFADPDIDGDGLLKQMDTPLVSIACAFDAFYALDTRRIAPVMGRLPASASFHAALEERACTPDPNTATITKTKTKTKTTATTGWECKPPTAPCQVLRRMGTATRADAEGAGLMKATAHSMMRRAADRGFRAIEIACFHDAVTAVWANPPLPFTGCVAGEVDTYALDEVGVDGRRRFPYRPVRRRLTKVYVTLR
ncbi:hypothetical protein F4777DRAFT_539680 [Nemania sp. FL0916]|nr:hypothetical protein F4777DRAFT_539680 [Nemania sp. FL0916]